MVPVPVDQDRRGGGPTDLVIRITFGGWTRMGWYRLVQFNYPRTQLASRLYRGFSCFPAEQLEYIMVTRSLVLVS